MSLAPVSLSRLSPSYHPIGRGEPLPTGWSSDWLGYLVVGTTPLLTDTVRVMPTDIFVYLPTVVKED
jgi:hypothetical protein